MARGQALMTRLALACGSEDGRGSGLATAWDYAGLSSLIAEERLREQRRRRLATWCARRCDAEELGEELAQRTALSIMPLVLRRVGGRQELLAGVHGDADFVAGHEAVQSMVQLGNKNIAEQQGKQCQMADKSPWRSLRGNVSAG